MRCGCDSDTDSNRAMPTARETSPHRVSRALRARNPGRVRKESRKSTPGQGPKSAERVRTGVSKESEKRKSGFRLFSDSFETPGRTLSALLGPCPGVLFPDSFEVPGPKGPADPVWGGADRNAKRQKHKHCETQPHFLTPLLLVGSKELVLKVPKRGQFHGAIRVTSFTLRFVCPSCIRDTDGIAAKLLRCGIASEALRRNMPLSRWIFWVGSSGCQSWRSWMGSSRCCWILDGFLCLFLNGVRATSLPSTPSLLIVSLWTLREDSELRCPNR